ncbi:MAG: M20/M25/M40 family metallo-hydrolase [Clostridia bacterium]|nr:M20/M25/M40 family metallo-hydrolase [Clostridia bacterium]
MKDKANICEKLFETIDALQDTYLDLLEDICNIESPTDCKAGVDEVGRYCIELAEKKGWRVEICPQSVSGDAVCITLNPGALGAPVVFSAHMDTVHPVGSFGTPAVRREGDKMIGPGTLDCKGGIAAALLAMDALERCGCKDRPVLLLLQSDEEKGSAPSQKATVRYMCEKSANAAAFLNLEGIRDCTVVVTRKGISRIKLTFKGKAAHSAICYNGANAIAEAAHALLALEGMKDADGLTCNCSMIKGGKTPNTVPDLCEFVADIRFANKAQKEKAYATVAALAASPVTEGCQCTYEEISYRPPMEYAERNMALLSRMNDIYRANGLPLLAPRNAKGGSDAAYVTEYGIPCVDSVGVKGDAEHTLGEYVFMTSVAEAAKRIAAVAYCL